MKFRQHIPNFFDGFRPEDAEITSLEDLLAQPFVVTWTKDPDFYRFSLSRPSEGSKLLMAELEKGQVWWVVGYAMDGDPGGIMDSLPEWYPKGKEGSD